MLLSDLVCCCFSALCSPQVYPELSSRQVLTTEWVNGITIDKVRDMAGMSTVIELGFVTVVCHSAYQNAGPPAREGRVHKLPTCHISTGPAGLYSAALSGSTAQQLTRGDGTRCTCILHLRTSLRVDVGRSDL